MGGTFHFLFKEQQYLQEILTTPIFLDILKLDHLNINEDLFDHSCAALLHRLGQYDLDSATS